MASPKAYKHVHPLIYMCTYFAHTHTQAKTNIKEQITLASCSFHSIDADT